MLLASYIVAALAMGGCAPYLFCRLRLFFTAAAMLLGSLLADLRSGLSELRIVVGREVDASLPAHRLGRR